MCVDRTRPRNWIFTTRSTRAAAGAMAFGFMVAITVAAAGAGAQTGTVPGGSVEVGPPPPADPWAPVSFLIGEWEATGGGIPGASTGSFSFTPELGGRVLIRRNLSESPGGRHEDLMMLYGEPQVGLRAIYADDEGHVIHYAVSRSEGPASVEFLSDALPGAPRFRLSYRMNPDSTVSISFDIAPPGSERFKTYVTGLARRR